MNNLKIKLQIKDYVMTIIKSYKAIFIGIIGGYIGEVIGLPLPWLLGSLGLNLLFAFTNVKIEFPTKLLNPVFLIIGNWLYGS